MLPINYHHLFYFWTIAKSGSIAAATKQLYLSQPALSNQLKQLEASCGARLLLRTRNGVSLTFEGRAVFERCERIFKEGEELTALIRNGFKFPAVLRMGVRPTISREVLLKVIDFAAKSYPSSKIAATGGEPEMMISHLKSGTVDLVISNRNYAPYLGAGFRTRLACRLPIYFVANPTISRKVHIFPRDLEKTFLLVKPSYNPARKHVDTFLAETQTICPVAAESDDADFLRRLAIKGHGVAILSGPSVENDLRSGRLLSLQGTKTTIEEEVWFACANVPTCSSTTRLMIKSLMSDFKFDWDKSVS
ncbi:MAG TPA: LysR family transcriptional regulator [Elusimicrobiales bacterium]|nr:LysR family transcriptional regulator [Elusimicrobiales bacterium]